MKPYKVIIVEGPDGAGKTTLIEKLVGHIMSKGRMADCHAHGPYLGSKNIVHHYLQSLEMAADQADKQPSTLIMDRSWYSEPIYGAHMRHGENRLTQTDLAYLEYKAMCLTTLVIMCYPPAHICLEAYKKRRELEYVDKEQKLVDIHHDYEQWFNSFYKLPKLYYNYKCDLTAESLLKEIE